MQRESLAVALAFDDDLVAGVGQPVEGAAREDRVVKQAAPSSDGAHGGEAERLGEEALARPDRTDEQHVLVAVDQLQRAGGVEQPSVERGLGGPFEVFQASDLVEPPSLAQTQF